MMEQLDAATTDDLIAELVRRFTGGLLVAGLRDNKVRGDSDLFYCEYHGGITLAMGLAQRSLAALTADSIAAGDAPDGERP